MKHLLFLVLCMVCTLRLPAQVEPGALRTSLYLPMLNGRTIGIVANGSSVVNGKNIVDTLVSLKIHVARIFSPEHGFRETAEAGAEVPGFTDPVTGIPVVSLYGKAKAPSPGDLAGLDLVVFDIQDVGVRFYTYISTLTLVMKACAENHVPLVVLDRPNPNGFYVDGPVLEKEDSSFVGMAPVPIVYGMTIGEYARMVAGEGWYGSASPCDLTVIPVANYTHSTPYELPANPSPNLTSMNAVWLYPSLCLFEGTVISVARGTCFPFEAFGHPDLRGFSFTFTPEEIPGMSIDPPFKGRLCQGVDLRNFYTDKPRLKGRINLAWLMMAYRDMHSDPDFFNGYFDKLAGNSTLREQIIHEVPENVIRASWQPGIDRFRAIRQKYLLYPG